MDGSAKSILEVLKAPQASDLTRKRKVEQRKLE